jgi:hypothetical protein
MFPSENPQDEIADVMSLGTTAHAIRWPAASDFLAGRRALDLDSLVRAVGLKAA